MKEIMSNIKEYFSLSETKGCNNTSNKQSTGVESNNDDDDDDDDEVTLLFIWDKVFKNRPSKMCGRQPLKNLTWFILEYFVPYVTMKNVITL